MTKSEVIKELDEWAEYEFGEKFIDLVLSHFRVTATYPSKIIQEDLNHLYSLEVLYRIYRDCGGLDETQD